MPEKFAPMLVSRVPRFFGLLWLASVTLYGDSHDLWLDPGLVDVTAGVPPA